MATIEEDRRYVIEQFRYFFDRLPTLAELENEVRNLQNGLSRVAWRDIMERYEVQDAVYRIFEEVLGRTPTDGAPYYVQKILSGQLTRETMRLELTNSPEAMLRQATPQDTPEEKDALVHLQNTLNLYGLGELSEWAWDQIKSGASPERILQSLRQQQAYKDRFVGMELRTQAGLPAISEAEYLEYERTARQLMQRAGLPADFYNEPADYAELIGKDISPIELQSRINDGWQRVVDAPPEVLAAFEQIYGISGPSELAAYMLDPERREADLLKRAEAARMVGIGSLYDLDLSGARAEEIFTLGVNADEAQEAFGRVGQIAPTFTESVSESEDLTAEDEGLNAVLGLDADSQRRLERRRATREASLSGGGGANVDRTGVGIGSAT